jgi:hypothetical protein
MDGNADALTLHIDNEPGMNPASRTGSGFA